MAIDDVSDKEVRDGLGISCFEGTGGYPFGKVVDGNDDVSFSSAGDWQRSYDVDSNLVERLQCFLDGF